MLRTSCYSGDILLLPFVGRGRAGFGGVSRRLHVRVVGKSVCWLMWCLLVRRFWCMIG